MTVLSKAVLVYSLATLGIAAVIAAAAAAVGGMGTPAAIPLVLGAMWAPALCRFITQRTVDRDWKSPLRLRWTSPRLAHVGVPLLIALLIYGAAYAAAAALGYTAWQPRWDGAEKIAINLAINVPIVLGIGFIGALGEELGWRGYLQPRLDAAGVRYAVLWVAMIWTVYHLPAILWAGYQPSSQPVAQIGLFALSCLADSLLWAWLCLRLGSVWPAVWFHAWHNFVSQWLFPAFFAKPKVELLLGEDGILPTAAHLIAAGVLLCWLRWGERDSS